MLVGNYQRPPQQLIDNLVGLLVDIYDQSLGEALRFKLNEIARTGMGHIEKARDKINELLAASASGVSFVSDVEAELRAATVNSGILGSIAQATILRKLKDALTEKIPLPIVGSLVNYAAELAFVKDYEDTKQKLALNAEARTAGNNGSSFMYAFHSPREAAAAASTLLTDYVRVLGLIAGLAHGPENTPESIVTYPRRLFLAERLASDMLVNLYTMERTVAVFKDRLNTFSRSIDNIKKGLGENMTKRIFRALQASFDQGRIDGMAKVNEILHAKGQVQGILEETHLLKIDPLYDPHNNRSEPPAKLAAKLIARCALNAWQQGYNDGFTTHLTTERNLRSGVASPASEGLPSSPHATRRF